jgi:hypothetical protein
MAKESSQPIADRDRLRFMAEEYRLSVIDAFNILLKMTTPVEQQEHAGKVAGIIGKGQMILTEIAYMTPVSANAQDSLIMEEFNEARRKIIEITKILKSLQ